MGNKKEVTINGEVCEIPRVTTICGEVGSSGGLLQWSVGCAIDWIKKQYFSKVKWDWKGENVSDLIEKGRTEWKSIGDQAMETGTICHRLIERYLKGDEFDLTKYSFEVQNGFDAFLKFKKEHLDFTHETEVPIVSEKHLYGGTLDWVGKLKNGKNYILDWKVGKKRDTHRLQLSAYRSAYLEMHPTETIDGMAVVTLDKLTGEYKMYDLSDRYEMSLKCFLNYLTAWYSFSKRKLKNNRIIKELWG